jgi:DNA-binding transcriptional LysR family regulator
LRGPRFRGLTPEGTRVLAWASQIVSDYENLKQEVAVIREGMNGTLRLGVIPNAMPAIASLTLPFCARHAGITVDVCSMTTAEIQAGIERFELDAGLTYLQNEPLANIRETTLYWERYVVVTHASSDLAQSKSVKWSEAVTQNLCLLNNTMQSRIALDKLVESMDLQLTPTVISNSYLAVCSHVCTGNWASIIPHTFSCMFHGCKDLALVELVEPRHSQAVGLVVSNRDPLSPLANALISCAAELREDRLSGVNSEH